ncbi:MAG: hypothetical protein AUJ49_06930 [Desulfovibrionaceae bacterium CG1_02_65_16]|nr:MAG: hypothetical protein AUJ49_06930 [Desulfovibrionaceae bacterium CG1_02_65_16]
MDKIQRLSSRLRVLFLAGMVSVPVLHAVGWAFFERIMATPPLNFSSIFGLSWGEPPFMAGPATLAMKLLGFCSSMLPGAAAMYGFACLAGLFGRFGKGEMFSAATVRLLRRLGWAVLVAQGMQVLHGSLASLILTMGNPPGRHVVTIGLDSATLAETVTGVVIILASWVMDEARKLKEEQELVI